MFDIMRPAQRHQQIIQLLLPTGVLSVKQLVDLLQVSEVTIRNDLRYLETHGKLIRTHGGAALGNLPGSRSGSNGNDTSKDGRSLLEGMNQLAQRAASIVNDGETILLLNSPFTRAMAEELLKLHAVTVLTNSLQIATTLKRNPANTVIVIGGQLQPDGDALAGPTAVNAVGSLHLQKAFITCDGLSLEQGLADDDIASATLKAAILSNARTVIALAPADRIGRQALMSFAASNQIHHLITTEGAPFTILNNLRAAGVQVTVCSKHLTQIAVNASQQHPWRIGFANLTEEQEFAVSVRQGLEQATLESRNVELILADNAGDPERALANAYEMLEKRVDLLIEYQQDEHTNYKLMDMCRSAGVPVIAIDIPSPGAIYYGADNYGAGALAGDAAVRWIRKHWHGKLDKVICLEQPESGTIPASRIEAQLDKLRTAFALDNADILHCATHGDLEGSQVAATQAMRSIPWNKHVLLIGINFNSALGSLAAAEALDRRENTVVISQNASARIRRELINRNPMLIGAVDFFPQHYGAKIIPLAINILERHPVPPALYTDHLLLTANNIRQVYAADVPTAEAGLGAAT
jgi:ribose transport system substrate-binding protein